MKTQNKNMDLFEDCTKVSWVKWSNRKPEHNGSIYFRFNGKNAGMGLVVNGRLLKLEGLAKSEFENYEDTFYWLEEIIDLELFERH